MYAITNPYQRYKQQEVMTASPVELIIMLYDGCIKQLKLARIAMEEKNPENANKSLQKAEQIIVELINSLDFHYDIARDLLNIYDFILSSIRKINASKDPSDIGKLVEMLSELRQSWSEISKTGVCSLAVMEE